MKTSYFSKKFSEKQKFTCIVSFAIINIYSFINRMIYYLVNICDATYGEYI